MWCPSGGRDPFGFYNEVRMLIVALILLPYDWLRKATECGLAKVSRCSVVPFERSGVEVPDLSTTSTDISNAILSFTNSCLGIVGSVLRVSTGFCHLGLGLAHLAKRYLVSAGA